MVHGRFGHLRPKTRDYCDRYSRYASSFGCADWLNRQRIDFRIIAGLILDELGQLPQAGRFILIEVDHYEWTIDLVAPHLPVGEMERMLQSRSCPPHFGWSSFQIGNRKLVWLAGGWREKRGQMLLSLVYHKRRSTVSGN